MLLVLVTGMPGSGKSLVASMLSSLLDAPMYIMGDIVRGEVARRGLELTVENVEMVARELRREMGMAAVAKLLLHEIRGIEANIVVVDGVRSLEEVEVLKGAGRPCIVAVHASPLTRYRRMMARARRGDIDGWSSFRMRDMANLSYGIGGVIAMADYMIVNEAGPRELEASVAKVAGEIRSGKGEGCSGGGDPSHRGPR
ncbi:MAG: AAA family ATPase [Desulfurococcales archaeon]|nr:AAA family ATPase [Desulfurococcales archaeon]